VTTTKRPSKTLAEICTVVRRGSAKETGLALFYQNSKQLEQNPTKPTESHKSKMMSYKTYGYGENNKNNNDENNEKTWTKRKCKYLTLRKWRLSGETMERRENDERTNDRTTKVLMKKL